MLPFRPFVRLAHSIQPTGQSDDAAARTAPLRAKYLSTAADDFGLMLHHAAEGATTISLHNEPEGTTLYQVCSDLGFVQ